MSFELINININSKIKKIPDLIYYLYTILSNYILDKMQNKSVIN